MIRSFSRHTRPLHLPNCWHAPDAARFLTAIVTTSIVALYASAAHAQGPLHASPTPWINGRILVAPNAGLSDTDFSKILGGHGARSQGKLNGIEVHVVELPLHSHGNEEAVARALSHNPHIKFAEVDELVPPGLIPNDTYYGSEWHLQMIAAPAAWDYSKGLGVTVAILDSGVDATHPDLAGQLVPGWNFFDNNSNTADVFGHGTKVAGVVAAVSNNAKGVTGVAWNAKIMPIRVTDTSGMATLSAFSNGLSYAADHGARVANLSFAVQSSATVQTAAQNFKNKGGVVVNSAGNYGALDSTAASDALVSVSATDSADARASWSSYGPYVDVSAPGVGIWTTTKGGGYGAVSGTSFASPLTAGIIALMKAVNPGLTPSQLVSVLKSSAMDRGTTGYDYYFGSGRVNAGAAVIAAKQGIVADGQPPTVIIASPTGGSVSGNVPVTVNASDNVGVTRVELLVNGGLLASDTTSPYTFSWNSSGSAGRTVTLVARAYDAAGSSASSQPRTVTVAATGTPDTTPPKVTISNPGNNSKVTGMVSIYASATDNVAVASLALYVDGVMVSSGNLASTTYKWNSRKAANGTHTISAVARDAAGYQATTTIQVMK